MKRRTMKWAEGLVCTAMLVLAGACADAPDHHSVGEADAVVTGVRLSLASLGRSGAEYRLTRATFTIDGLSAAGEPVLQTVSVDPLADDKLLNVPVPAGTYRVTLADDWEISMSWKGSPFTPVAATLWGDNPIEDVYVRDLDVEPVEFFFVLGQSGIGLHFYVDEQSQLPPGSVPEGYDGVIWQDSSGFFAVYVEGGSVMCCWSDITYARGRFPGMNLYYDERRPTAPQM